MNRSTKSFVRMVGFLILGFVDSAGAVALKGRITTYFSSYHEVMSSVDLMVNGVLITTGDIVATLDTTHPQGLVSVYDFDAMTHTMHLDLLFSAPFLASLGLPPERIHIDDVGTIDQIIPVSASDLAPGVPTLIEIISTTQTSGTLTSGLLQSFTYSAIKKKDPGRCPKYPPQSLRVTVNASGEVTDLTPPDEDNLCLGVDGTFTDTSGNASAFSGVITGRMNPTALPEPSTLALLGASLAGLAGRRAVRRRARFPAASRAG